MEIMAIIPARSGSKGAPGKNIRLLGGYPLIAFSIAAAKLARQIGRVLVSTDTEEIAAIARVYGGETPFLRPPELAQDSSSDKDFMLHAINWLDDYEGRIPDYLVHLRPTTPLRDPWLIDAAVDVIRNRAAATSLRSAHLAPESPLKWFQLDAAGCFKGFLAGMDNEILNKPRQEFRDAYIPDGYVDIVIPSFIRNTGLLHGDQMIGFTAPFCIEVDTMADFDFLEYTLQKNGSVIWEYLRKYFPKRGTANVRV